MTDRDYSSHIQVPPDGPKDCKIAIVGEAPGSTEVQLGRPFVGSSGQLLDRMLHSAGISRGSCYITNVVKERPPNNDITHFIKIDRGRAKTTPEYDAYEAELLTELKSVTANVVVACGATPLWALCRRVGITKLRGSILSGPDGRKVIPTIHPASALRQYLFTYPMQLDFRRIAQESLYPDIVLPQRALILRPTFDQCLAFITELRQAQLPVAFDIEVLNLEVSCISLCNDPCRVISIPFVESGHDYFSPEQEVAIWKEIAALLSDPRIPKVGQNIIFDSSFLLRRYGILVTPKDDTMVGQGYVAPELPKGLDFITAAYTKEPYYKDEGKKWFKLPGSFETLWAYNAKDSAVCLEALPKILRDVELLGNTKAYRDKIALIDPLIYMQERGILMDLEGLRRESEEAGKEILRLTAEFHEMAGSAVNPASTQQLQHLFYNLRGFKPIHSRKTGSVTTDEKALKKLMLKGSKEAAVVLKIRKLEKRKGTYFDVQLDPDSRFRCAYNPVGTKGERISSSTSIFDTGGNFQNIPMDVRRFMLADPGYVIYGPDLSQAENRVVAYIAPDLNMIKAFEDGIDIHRLTASFIFNKPVGEISTDEDVEDDPERASDIGDGLHSERYWGKKANHSLNYDMGDSGFAAELEVPLEDAKFIRAGYHSGYPGVNYYYSWIQEQLRVDRTLVDCYGRKRRFLDRWGDDLFKSAYSFIPQSTVATKLNNHGIMFLWNGRYPVELLGQIHDSVIFQISLALPWRTHAEILCPLRDSLEQPVTWRDRQFVIPADCKAGFNLRDMKKIDWHKHNTPEALAIVLEETFTKEHSNAITPAA